MATDMPIPCHLIARAVDPSEISLAENALQVVMHPADQFEAFRSLIDGGAGTADIAARFGIPEASVIKRMKLGRVSPALLDIYRAGDMSLDQVQAFSISDDHEAQERVWSGLPTYSSSPHTIRARLTQGEIPATDKRVRFVGLAAYV
jgi:ParB family transcriptional regulator, chromosome partitioning protein